MKIVIGRLSVEYSGRGETYLPEYNRMVIWKNDGTISIHSETGFKPLNYMTNTTREIFHDEDGKENWKFTANKESIIIKFYEIFKTIEYNLGDNDPGLIREKTEDQLQEWVSININSLNPNLVFSKREYETGNGAVDILCKNIVTGEDVIVEIKRTAGIDAVGQVLRYLDGMHEKEGTTNKNVESFIAAVDFKAKTIELAKKKNIKLIKIPKKWYLDEIKTVEKTLFDVI